MSKLGERLNSFSQITTKNSEVQELYRLQERYYFPLCTELYLDWTNSRGQVSQWSLNSWSRSTYGKVNRAKFLFTPGCLHLSKEDGLGRFLGKVWLLAASLEKSLNTCWLLCLPRNPSGWATGIQSGTAAASPVWDPLSWWLAWGAATDHQVERQNAEQVGSSCPFGYGAGIWDILKSCSYWFPGYYFSPLSGQIFFLSHIHLTLFFCLCEFLLKFLIPLVNTRKPWLRWVFMLWCSKHTQYMQATSTLSRFDMAENVVIVASQKRPLGGRELQLPSMSMLTSKTSTQKFFLRVLQVIIQLRDDTRRANKKAKQTGRLGMELGYPVEGQGWW